MTLKLRVNWSGMVYSQTGTSDLFLILCCMASNFLYLSFFYFVLWLFMENWYHYLCYIKYTPLSNKPPISIKLPLLKCVFKTVKPLTNSHLSTTATFFCPGRLSIHLLFFKPLYTLMATKACSQPPKYPWQWPVFSVTDE